MGTVCIDSEIVAVTNGSLYNIHSGSNCYVTFDVVPATRETPIAAGTPLLVVPENGKVAMLTLGNKDASIDGTEVNSNGFVGMVTGGTQRLIDNSAGNCILVNANGKLQAVGTNTYLTPEHAYIDLTGIVSSSAPTRRRLVIGRQDMPTDNETVGAEQSKTRKVVENGTLYIIKNGVRYNALGQIAD